MPGRRQQQIDRNIADIGDFKVTTIEPGGFDIVLANPPYVKQELIKDFKPLFKEVFPQTFCGTADLYTYFYSRAVEMLAPGGILVFISSNKWLRAAYGARLRKYISEQCKVQSITDFGELPVFETSATFPMIFLAKKTNIENDSLFTQVKSLEAPYPDIKTIIQKTGIILPNTSIKGEKWNLSDSKTADMLQKMEKTGPSLKEYVKEQIYYGIKTGFNKAFLIDDETKNNLISEDRASKEIIKPMCIGDDVQKWYVQKTNRWLIVTHIGININKYQAIFRHLKQWKSDLEERADQGDHWWELRACTYYDTFEKPKILIPAFAMAPKFCIDYEKMYVNAPCYFLSSSDLYLLGVMNSSPAFKYLQFACTILGDQNKRGRVVLRPIYFSKLPIPCVSTTDRNSIEKLVQKCLDAKGIGCEAWEKEIDNRVAALYGL
jgi:hypothetical protein